jgi:Mo-dependent nitrogenase C-terminus
VKPILEQMIEISKKFYQLVFLPKLIMFIFTSTSSETKLQSQSLSGILLHPVRQWLESIEVCDAKVAKLLCQLIPSHCPFERDIQLLGHTLFHIPPLCKLNPLYEQLISLRFRALTFLADVCGEDVTPYCC